MAQKDDARAALKALANYADPIIDAYLGNGNCLDDSDANSTVIRSLNRHRLLWRLDETEGFQLKNPVIRLLDQVTQSYRRQMANEHIAELWKQLQDRFEDYQETLRTGAYRDRDRLEQEIRELMHEIMDDMATATSGFFAYINSGFSYVTDPALRIRENEKVIQQAGNLNQLFDTFRIEDLVEYAGQNTFLKRLLLKHLQAELEKSQTTLAFALNQLRKMLVRLREDQRLNRMLGALHAHFANNPGYLPSIDDLTLDRCPDALNQSRPMALVAYNDLTDFRQDEIAAEIAASIRRDRPRSPDTDIGFEAVEITQDLDSESIEEVSDPMDLAVDELLETLTTGEMTGLVISARKIKRAHLPDLDPVIWLHSIAAGVDSLSATSRNKLDVEFVGVRSELYEGNDQIHDIILRQRSHE
ncbi:hypothetical protein [Marinobacter sp. X15-166B]|uniref:hypothetical protein n=1 Tax=Marinobacter sp. X15-166B TaxID=1897620 RepID=UPI00085C8F7C|nr:hypothetical protein [Marinobacter sp. X15-166B]OEY67556.1 hypothetical protein BG841_14695 [Marinobacter sp. X15-166B]